jgi:adenylate kinase family enzyme
MKPVIAVLGMAVNPIVDEFMEWNKQLEAIANKLKRMRRKHPKRENLEIEFSILLMKIEIRAKCLQETIDEVEEAKDKKRKNKKKKAK